MKISNFAIYFNQSPPFVFINRLNCFFASIICFLNINPRHYNFVEILYFVIGLFFHKLKYISLPLYNKLNMRQKHKSNVAVFHTAKGGAVPTLTHHKMSEESAKNG